MPCPAVTVSRKETLVVLNMQADTVGKRNTHDKWFMIKCFPGIVVENGKVR